MITGINGFMGACKRRPVFKDLGQAINSDDFESWTEGTYVLSDMMPSLKADFEQYANLQTVSFSIDPYPRAYTDFETQTEATVITLPKLSVTGLNSSEATTNSRFTWGFPYAFTDFESDTVGTTTTPTTLSVIGEGSFPQPTGAFTQVYL